MKEQHDGIAASSIIASAIERSRLLEGLTMSDRASVLAASSKRCLKANSVPIHQGDKADTLFLICNGRARHFYITPQGKKILLFWLTEGQIFGGSALLSTPTEYIVGTEILRDSCLLIWPRRAIRAKRHQHRGSRNDPPIDSQLFQRLGLRATAGSKISPKVSRAFSQSFKNPSSPRSVSGCLKSISKTL